ncbi:17462_t:CDS:2, partial [Racocetra persica]
DQVRGQHLNNKWLDICPVDVKDNNDVVEKLVKINGKSAKMSIRLNNVVGCVSCADVVVYNSRKASFVVNEDCVIENSEDEKSNFIDIRCIKSESMENDDVDCDEKEKSEIINIIDSDKSNHINKMKVENFPNEFLEVGEVMPELKSAKSVSDDAENDNKGCEAADGRMNDSRNCSKNKIEKKKDKSTAFNNHQKSFKNKHEASE